MAYGAEKFMDHGFVASIMRDATVPPWDPWFAGGTLNVYYYYGYWIMGVLGLSSGAPSGVVFILGLPTVLALAGVNCYMVGHLLLERYRWLPVLPLILPNLPSVLYAAQGIPLSKVAWDSTRVIAYTINEYPLFSFTWGDLHAHVLGIFNQAFLIALLVLGLRCWQRFDDRARLVLVGIVALSLGAMPGINSWDVLIYGPVTLVVAGLIWARSRNESGGGRVGPLVLLVAAPLLAIALYAPYYLSLASSGIKGVGLVLAPSDPVEFLLVHGIFLAIAFLASLSELRRRPYLIAVAVPFLLGGYVAAGIAAVPLACLVVRLASREGRGRPEDLLVALGLAVALSCELVYLRDNMGDLLFRQNTVFKFYIAAWLLMGTGTFVMVGRFLDRPEVNERVARVPVPVRRVVSVAVLALLLASPFLAAGNFTHDTYSLDGLAFLDRWHPGDADAVRFLRGLDGHHVIVEAEGGDYTYAARISSFTGIPTVIGWTFHEYMWRDDYAMVQERAADVRAAYGDPSRTVAVMEKYGADLLYVGDLERETYAVSLPSTGLEPVYDAGGVQIYRRAGTEA
jgi:YYY domain-containing protein